MSIKKNTKSLHSLNQFHIPEPTAEAPCEFASFRQTSQAEDCFVFALVIKWLQNITYFEGQVKSTREGCVLDIHCIIRVAEMKGAFTQLAKMDSSS